MNITEVRVFPVDDDKLRAFCSIVIDDAFVVSDIKIIEGRGGRFLSMPSVRRRDGSFRDIAHPVNAATRADIEERIFARYEELVSDAAPVTSLDAKRRERRCREQRSALG